MEKKRKIPWEAVFLAAVFLVYTAWAVVQPLNASPDEKMRYDIVQFIYQYGTLPHGGDARIRNELWGISYGFNPITSYILGAAFARVAGIFTDSETVLLIAARMVNVLLGVGTAFFTWRLGKLLLRKEAAGFFTSLVCFLPGTIFLFSYVNTDGLALFSAAWILYCWGRTLKEGWTGILCVQMGAAMALCALSYYNAYGYLVCSAFFFAGSVLLGQKPRWDFRELLKKGIWMLALVLLLAGWWFVRNAILYHGDFLGMETSSQYAQMYAIEELKPSNRVTPQAMGMSVTDMMLWVPGEWKHNWLITVAVSFIGTFGRMDIFMPYLWSKCYILIIGLGLLGMLLRFRRQFFPGKPEYRKSVKKEEDAKVVTITVVKQNVWDRENLMRLMMVFAVLIPFGLLIYYAYASDFQAQGRYLMPILLPLMYFVTLGYENWFERVVKNGRARRIFFRLGAVISAVSSAAVYFIVFLPSYL